MTSQKLYETLQLIVNLDESFELQTSLTQIKDNLTSLTAQPAGTQFQTSLASALSQFSGGANQLKNTITPSQILTIEELGGAEFFDPSIAEKVRSSIERNAMTPSVARDFVKDIASRRADYLQTVNTTLGGLTNLLSADKPMENAAPGEAAFTIPRTLFDNRLGMFAKELNFINLMVEHMSEAESGEIQPVELEYLSSSIPTVAICAGIGLLKLLASVINSFLDAWKKVEEIRELRERLKAVGVSGSAADELTDRITTTIEEVVEESTGLTLSTYTKDGGRRNELKNALKIDFQRLFGQIERGLIVEIRMHESANADKSNAAEVQAIADLTKQFIFPIVAVEPLLLTSNEILEGDVSRKTLTTKKTTTQKKSTKTK